MLIEAWCWSGEGSALLQLEDAVGPVLSEKWLDCWKPQCEGELLHKINKYLVPLVIPPPPPPISADTELNPMGFVCLASV